MPKTVSIHWFRQDLRILDNPALVAASKHGRVLPVYILDDANADSWSMGAASRWWLHHSLQALDRSLSGKLWVLRGDASELLPELATTHKAGLVTWNRCYEPWRITRDTQLKTVMRERGVAVDSSNGCLLFEPGAVIKGDGTPYKVFTPFYKQALSLLPDSRAMAHAAVPELHSCEQAADKIDQLQLLPATNWYSGLQQSWHPGEAGARDTLRLFLDTGLQSYRDGRDYPARQSVSRLSPHLHFGEISPQQALSAIQQRAQEDGTESQAEHFVRELMWREFSYALLYTFPDLTTQNLKPLFDHFPWRKNEQLLQKWQQGQTGFPLIDAGMRELWRTGYMHNRVRMIVASFLVKNLMMHWSEGARWFWDCLVDADLANNSCSWQWVAGSGMDAAPYFRIFNPVTQSQRFDADGAYIRRFVPELAALPLPYLHDPSSAPADELARAGIQLDRNYPRAIVDLRETRASALAAYKSLQSIG